MNNTTRSIIFFTGLLAMIFFYFIIIPVLPFAFTNALVYMNYLAATVLLIFPFAQLGMRQFVLKKYKMDEDQHLFSLGINDIRSVQLITYILLDFLIVLLPITTNQFHFDKVTTSNWIVFVGWLLFCSMLIRITYATTKAHFGTQYVLIKGFDFRLDFPFGSQLYSNSGVYFYEDFKYYYIEGQYLYLILHNDKGKIAVKITDNISGQLVGFLTAQKVKQIKPY